MSRVSGASARHPRIAREEKTVEAMIRIYCRDQHHVREVPCSECHALLEYAGKRLSSCPFQAGKTPCARCPIHCYKPAMRERIRAVMRYAGPRMIFRHPILAIYHLMDGRQKAPVEAAGGKARRAYRFPYR